MTMTVKLENNFDLLKKVVEREKNFLKRSSNVLVCEENTLKRFRMNFDKTFSRMRFKNWPNR